jgi:sugar/nucleoside kinase (ribokinase family)
VIITRGSQGSLVCNSGGFTSIPAYRPVVTKDATGCGDTYMAGYLYKRCKGAGIKEAGEFAAAMATLKLQASGPFSGTPDAIYEVLRQHPKQYAEEAIGYAGDDGRRLR